VHDAFWSLIEQLVVAPPFAELRRCAALDARAEGGRESASPAATLCDVAATASASARLLVRQFVRDFADMVLAPLLPPLVAMLAATSLRELGRDLYQRRRQLAAALLRVEALCADVPGTSGDTATALVCGCSKLQWDKLRESVLIAVGG
jgi:hypothetical protein